MSAGNLEFAQIEDAVQPVVLSLGHPVAVQVQDDEFGKSP